MITADQLLAHAVGDYILQSDWMVKEKHRNSAAAGLHCIFYLLPFALLTQSMPALAIVAVSHFFVDRFRMARYVIWLKNRPWPGARPWAECRETGYPPDTPPWLSGWLFIIVDNVIHIVLNGAAIQYFG